MITRIFEIGGNEVASDANGGLRKRIYHFGKSTDTKPESANNADIFYEMDKRKIYLFDIEDGVWLEQ